MKNIKIENRKKDKVNKVDVKVTKGKGFNENKRNNKKKRLNNYIRGSGM